MKSRDVETDSHIEGNLAAEVSMVALDTLELVIQVRFKVSVYLCFCTIMNSFWKKKKSFKDAKKEYFWKHCVKHFFLVLQHFIASKILDKFCQLCCIVGSVILSHW